MIFCLYVCFLFVFKICMNLTLYLSNGFIRTKNIFTYRISKQINRIKCRKMLNFCYNTNCDTKIKVDTFQIFYTHPKIWYRYQLENPISKSKNWHHHPTLGPKFWYWPPWWRGRELPLHYACLCKMEFVVYLSLWRLVSKIRIYQLVLIKK